MPSASANISAKFIDQIEMSAIRVPIQSEPAAATNPAIVSISGSPAATSEPNASTRMASVTGHEISSDFIIADLFAWLKSDHMPGAPVRSTRIPSEPSFASGPFSSSAARTMSFALRAAPAWITAVWRSGEIDTPARGADRRHRRIAPQPGLAPARSTRRERGIGDGLVRRVNDDRQAVAPEPVEVLVDQLSRLHGLGPGRLPTGSRQRRLDTRREDARDRPRARPRSPTTVREVRRRSSDPASRSVRPAGRSSPGGCRDGT